jgi:serine/threonine protein kinase/HEAT repeat protein
VQKFDTAYENAVAILEAIYKTPLTPTLLYAGNNHVYRFSDPLGQPKILKLMQAQKIEDKERFQLEQEILLKLQRRFANPTVVIDHFHEQGSWLGLVMEYVDGPNLQEWLSAQSQPLPFAEAAKLMLKILQNMACVHHEHIVHRDLKPANILLCKGEPVIGDFGIAKPIAQSSLGANHPTRTGVIVGTVGYMAPEQVAGYPCHKPADVFALGIIFYQLLTLQHPFEYGDFGSYIEYHNALTRGSDLKPLLRFHQDIQYIIRKSLEFKPQDRFADAQEMKDALENFTQGKRIHRTLQDRVREGHRKHKRSIWAVTGILAVLLLWEVYALILKSIQSTLLVWEKQSQRQKIEQTLQSADKESISYLIALRQAWFIADTAQKQKYRGLVSDWIKFAYKRQLDLAKGVLQANNDLLGEEQTKSLEQEIAAQEKEEFKPEINGAVRCKIQGKEVPPEILKKHVLYVAREKKQPRIILSEKEVVQALIPFSRQHHAAIDFNDVATALGKMGAVAIPHLIPLLDKDNDKDVRNCAALALGKMGAVARDAIPHLIPLLKNKYEVRVFAEDRLKNDYVRISAIWALGEMGEVAREAIPYLISLLKNNNRYEQICAAGALIKMGPIARDAIPHLILHLTLLLKNEDQERGIVEVILGRMGAMAKYAIPHLIPLLKDQNKNLRYCAANVLGNMGELAIPHLIPLLKDRDKQLRNNAAWALGKIGKVAREAIPPLIPLLQD